MSQASLYAAILARDKQCDDAFFFAVTSTGIYCRPSCPARRPKLKNCQFFSTAQEAEKHGFRACKRCRPNQPKNLAVIRFQTAILGDVQHASDINSTARYMGLGERQFRRIIKCYTNATPLQAYRLQQLAYAYDLLLKADDLRIIDIVYQANFKSVRQFNTLFKQHYGLSPSQIRKEGA